MYDAAKYGAATSAPARAGRDRCDGAGRAPHGFHRPEVPACRRDGGRLRSARSRTRPAPTRRPGQREPRTQRPERRQRPHPGHAQRLYAAARPVRIGMAALEPAPTGCATSWSSTTTRYQIWLARADKVHSAQRQWADPRRCLRQTDLESRQPQRPGKCCRHDEYFADARRLITAMECRVAAHRDRRLRRDRHRSIEPAAGLTMRPPSLQPSSIFMCMARPATTRWREPRTHSPHWRISCHQRCCILSATTVTAPVDRTLRALEGIADAIEQRKHELSAPAAPSWEFISKGRSSPTRSAGSIRPPTSSRHRFRCSSGCSRRRAATSADDGRAGNAGRAGSHRICNRSRHTCSLGHSDATAEQTRAAIAAGATSATHTFNAMRCLDHREPGIAGVVLDTETLYAELICDGIHVAPEFVRMWLRAKGEERAILVTDGISATGMPDGNYMLGEFEVTVRDGRCLSTERSCGGRGDAGRLGADHGSRGGQSAAFHRREPGDSGAPGEPQSSTNARAR
jgi:hypothetical protein